MRVLAIETSSKILGVAILDDKGGGIERNSDLGLRHTSHLIPTIKDLLERSRLKLKDIDAYAVSIGPGSFTGLRIGVATVKALTLVTKKKVVAVPSLDVLARGVPETQRTICVIIDAKKEKLYACFYKYKKAGLKRISPYLLITYEELFRKLKAQKNDIILVGDGIEKLKAQNSKLKTEESFLADEKLWYPRAMNVAKIGLEMLKQGKTVKDVDALTPYYMHAKDVQCRE